VRNLWFAGPTGSIGLPVCGLVLGISSTSHEHSELRAVILHQQLTMCARLSISLGRLLLPCHNANSDTKLRPWPPLRTRLATRSYRCKFGIINRPYCQIADMKIRISSQMRQQADCREFYNCSAFTRKMPVRCVLIGGKDVLVDLERSRDVSASVGLSHMPDAQRCDASVHCLVACGISPNTALSRDVQVTTDEWFHYNHEVSKR
jgi:hypothetical protein